LRIYQPAAYRAHSVSPFAQPLQKPIRPNLSLVKLHQKAQWSAEALAIPCDNAKKRLILHILRCAPMPLRRGLDQFGHYRVRLQGQTSDNIHSDDLACFWHFYRRVQPAGYRAANKIGKEPM
jgi:hypothetical protein